MRAHLIGHFLESQAFILFLYHSNDGLQCNLYVLTFHSLCPDQLTNVEHSFEVVLSHIWGDSIVELAYSDWTNSAYDFFILDRSDHNIFDMLKF